MADLSQFLGGGFEVGQIVASNSSAVKNKTLLACDGSSFVSGTYPNLAAVTNISRYMESFTTVVNMHGTGGAANPRFSFFKGGDFGGIAYHFSVLARNTGAGDIYFQRVADVYGTPSTTQATNNTSFIIGSVEGMHADMSDNGSAIVVVATSSTATNLTCAYWNGSSFTFDTSIITATGSFNNNRNMCAVSGDGSRAFAVAYDPAATSSIRWGYSNSPTSLTILTVGSVTGLPSISPSFFATNGNGSVLYLGDAAADQLYVNTNPTGGGTWSLAGSLPTFFSTNTSAIRCQCTTDGTGLFAKQQATTSSSNMQIGTNRFMISSDSGATNTEITNTATKTSNQGAK